MTASVKPVAAVALVALGMAGLHFGVEYSGWVLFVGAMVSFRAF